MSSILLENWFDYEMNNRLDINLLDSIIESNIEEIDKIFNAIDVCNENGIITNINEGAFKDKIHEIFTAMKDKLKEISSILKSLMSDKIKQLIELLNKARGALGDKFDVHYLPDFVVSFKDESIANNINTESLEGFKKYFRIKEIIKKIDTIDISDDHIAMDADDIKDTIDKINNIKIEAVPVKTNKNGKIEVNKINDVDNGTSHIHSYQEVIKKINKCNDFSSDVTKESDLMQKMLDNIERKFVYNSNSNPKNLSQVIKSLIIFFKVYISFLNNLKTVLIRIISNGMRAVSAKEGV